MTPLERLQATLSGSRASDADVAALLRHHIRHESEVTHTTAHFSLAALGRSIDPEILDQFGISINGQGGEHYAVALRWHPHWIPGSAETAVDAASCRKDLRRVDHPVGFEPILQLATDPPSTSYRTSGQRDSVRAVLNMPAGSTLLVILQTGAGKSLCGLLPAVLESPFPGIEGGAVTVVVVPTVALAQDQARKASSLIEGPLAYTAGSARNKEIAKRIEANQQRLVFTSPESLTGSLRASLLLAASRQYLRAFIVDEAHLVEQWGDAFRPEFQHMAGLRTHLLELQPSLRTILLSATVTESSLESLRLFFGKSSPFATVAACALRPEPEHWVAACRNPFEKQRRVAEAVHHLPRPLVLYTSRVLEAKRYYHSLQQQGFTRMAVVTGSTPDVERLRIVNKWAANEIDIVIGTSAFGLGIDKADVRAVIHACVPESLDRLYQEIGRGGRDGHASTSLLIYSPEDLYDSKRIGDKRLIGEEKGFQRWLTLFENAEHLGGRLFKIDLTSAPHYIETEFEEANDKHAEWNAHTLTLMARSNLISFQDSFDTNEGQPVALTWIVKTEQDDHNDREAWNRAVSSSRERSRRRTVAQQRLLTRLLSQKECVADVFRDAYLIRRKVPVAKACGGCHKCREEHRQPYSLEIEPTSNPWPSELSGIEPEAIFYRGRREEIVDETIKRLLSDGVRLLVGNRRFLERFAEFVLTKRLTVFFEESYHVDLPAIPTAVFVGTSESVAAALQAELEQLDRSHRLVAVMPLDAELTSNGRKAFTLLPCRKALVG